MQKTNKPKILVGSPVYSNKKYISPYWIESVLNLAYPNYDAIVVDNSNPSEKFDRIFSRGGIKVITSEPHENPFQRLAEARQKLNDYAVKNNYDFLMSIEQDVIVPPDIIARLLAHQKLIVGAPYIVSTFTDENRRVLDYVVSASKLEKIIGQVDSVDVNEWFITKEISGKGLIQVKSCSLGCTLISTEVLKGLRVRYNLDVSRADDSYFFHDCQASGIPVFLDTSLLWAVDHIKRLGGEIPVGRSFVK